MYYLILVRRHIVTVLVLTASLFFAASATSQNVENFKITREQAQTMRDANPGNANANNVKAITYSIAELRAILDKAVTDSVQFQFVRKEGKANLIIAIMVNNPAIQPVPANGPSVNITRKLFASPQFFDAGKICPPPAGCMILE
jgi:hypothetical protein